MAQYIISKRVVTCLETQCSRKEDRVQCQSVPNRGMSSETVYTETTNPKLTKLKQGVYSLIKLPGFSRKFNNSLALLTYIDLLTSSQMHRDFENVFA